MINWCHLLWIPHKQTAQNTEGQVPKFKVSVCFFLQVFPVLWVPVGPLPLSSLLSICGGPHGWLANPERGWVWCVCKYTRGCVCVCVCVTKCVLMKQRTFISQTLVQRHCRFLQQINRERSVELAPSFAASSHAGCSKQRRSNICARPSWWDYTHKKTEKKNVYEKVACWVMCVYMFV